jgi:hypothetical protein
MSCLLSCPEYWRPLTRSSLWPNALGGPVSEKPTPRDLASGLDALVRTLRIRSSQGSARKHRLLVQISQTATNDDESVK